MQWDFTALTNLATGYWSSSALMAAVELNLFEALSEAPATAGQLARRGGASERHLAALLDTLTGLELLARENGIYRLAPGAAALLDPKSPTCLLAALRFNSDLYPLWGRLAQTVRSGAPTLPPTAHLGQDPERTRRFVLGMHGRAQALAPLLLPALRVEDCATLLDIGSGPGTFSRRLAETHAGLRVTQMDLPAVMAVARELAQTSPAADRLSFREGSYRSGDFGGPFEAALYCGALHQETPESAVDLFRRIRKALRPGGRAIVVDFMLEAGGTTPAFACLFTLQMMLTSPAGRVFEIPETEKLLGAAGFFPHSTIRLTTAPYVVITAEAQ